MRRRNVLLAVLPLAIFAFGTTAHAATFLSFNSQPGDHIGNGQQWTYTPSDGSISVSGGTDGAHVHFFGDTGAEGDLSFFPPAGATFAPGMYDPLVWRLLG